LLPRIALGADNADPMLGDSVGAVLVRENTSTRHRHALGCN
jgi:hypothetical protein